jgi:hypothetical protein
MVALIAEAFPTFADRVLPFATDWLGRAYAIDLDRQRNDEPLVLQLDPATGETLEVPATLTTFHDVELVDYPEDAIALTYYGEWRESAPKTTLNQDSCVGFRIPLFLGGSDDLANLEVTDLNVHWSLSAQIRGAVGEV